MSAPLNALFYGDNLDILRQHVGDAPIDLTDILRGSVKRADMNAARRHYDVVRPAGPG